MKKPEQIDAPRTVDQTEFGALGNMCNRTDPYDLSFFFISFGSCLAGLMIGWLIWA